MVRLTMHMQVRLPHPMISASTSDRVSLYPISKSVVPNHTWLPLLPILCMTRQVNTAKHSAVLIRPEVENRLVILTVEVTRSCVGAETRSCEQQIQGAVCSR